MSTITEDIFNSLKENGFDISLLELGRGGSYSERNAIGVRVNKTYLKFESGWY